MQAQRCFAAGKTCAACVQEKPHAALLRPSLQRADTIMQGMPERKGVIRRTSQQIKAGIHQEWWAPAWSLLALWARAWS